MSRLNLIKERVEGLEESEELSEENFGRDRSDTGDKYGGPVCDPDDPVDASLLRSERDVVISGPLSTYKGSGRRFPTQVEALHWAQDKYGFERVSLVAQPEGAPRWAVLVKNLRNS